MNQPDTLTRALSLLVPATAGRDILTTAIESGIAYWANEYANLDIERDADGMVTRLIIGAPLADGEHPDIAPVRHTVEPVHMLQAIAHLLLAVHDESIPDHAKVSARYASELFGEMLDADGCGMDANGCDVLVQVAVFGRVVFG